MIELSTLIINKDNPRDIEPEKFEKLCESIKRDSKFMELRPIIVDQNSIIIAGNMRFRALRALEYKSVPISWVIYTKDLTEEERRRFIIIDNLSYGHMDWDILTGQYSEKELIEWGLDLPMEPIEDDPEEPPPISHALKIQCDDLDDLITLRDMLDIEVDAKSITFGKFRLIFENRKE